MELSYYYISLFKAHATNKLKSTEQLLSLADRCVKCGMCAPSCPTYQLSQREPESPRGRIALIQGILTEKIDLDSAAEKHLKSCLLCRSCERICPSGVSFTQLMDAVRAKYPNHFKPRRLTFLKAITQTKKVARLAWFSRLYQKTGLQKITQTVRYFGNKEWRQLDALLPKKVSTRSLDTFYPSGVKNRQGHIALFSGCMAKQFDRQTVDATITLLNRMGFDITIPTEQACCGALHLHSGDREQAIKLATENLTAFDKPEFDAIIYTATGCGAQLADYATYPELNNSQQKFIGRLSDIGPFLLSQASFSELRFHPLNKRAMVHLPCSQNNALRQGDSSSQLLAAIPQLNLSKVSKNISCCGAAGSYMLEQPESANALRERLLQSLPNETELLITSNLGCQLHLASQITTLHPVTLLAQQLLD